MCQKKFFLHLALSHAWTFEGLTLTELKMVYAVQSFVVYLRHFNVEK